MDNNFTKQIQDWLNAPASERDYEQGAMLLLKLTGNQIMYRNLTMRRTTRNEEFIEYQLKRRLKFRLAQVTHKEVEEMQRKVDGIAAEHGLEKKETISGSPLMSVSVRPYTDFFQMEMKSTSERRVRLSL